MLRSIIIEETHYLRTDWISKWIVAGDNRKLLCKIGIIKRGSVNVWSCQLREQNEFRTIKSVLLQLAKLSHIMGNYTHQGLNMTVCFTHGANRCLIDFASRWFTLELSITSLASVLYRKYCYVLKHKLENILNK